MPHPVDSSKEFLKDHKKQTLIVAGTLVLVVIAYATYKKMSASSAANVANPTTGVTGDPGAATDQSAQEIANAIGSQTGLLSGILTQAQAQTNKLTNLNQRVMNLNKKLAQQRRQNRKENKELTHIEATLKKIRTKSGTTTRRHPAKKLHDPTHLAKGVKGPVLTVNPPKPPRRKKPVKK